MFRRRQLSHCRRHVRAWIERSDQRSTSRLLLWPARSRTCDDALACEHLLIALLHDKTSQGGSIASAHGLTAEAALADLRRFLNEPDEQRRCTSD